ncbi:MAG: histidine kinase, partial [Chloroflexota bacterium]
NPAIISTSDYEDSHLNIAPISIIEQVADSLETLVLDDATRNPHYNQDPYILKNQPESVLCLPLINQGRLRGILYLENNLTPAAFTQDRLDVLTLLSTQAATSIENAKLYQGLQQEVVERMRAEAIAQANEARFRHLFENAPLGMFELDVTSTPIIILAANRQAETIYGWSADEFVGMPLAQIIPSDTIPDLRQWLHRSEIGEFSTSESTNLRRDGSAFPVRLSVTVEIALAQERITLIVEDISAEKERQEAVATIEAERRRIAHEIHDGLGQTLAGLRIKTKLWSRLLEQNPEKMKDEIAELRSILNGSIQEVRRSIFALRPVVLEELGFFPALRQFLSNFAEQHQLIANLDIRGDEEYLQASLELMLFRIIQEALNNVGKHAQATQVKITLDLTSMERLWLTIEDNGQGFDLDLLESAYKHGHLGLVQMRERIEETEGTLIIESKPDQGTTLKIMLPWK